MNGTKGVRAERTEEFARELAEAFPDIPYHFWDERLTTVMAQRELIAADVSRKKRKKVIDKIGCGGYPSGISGPPEHAEKRRLTWRKKKWKRFRLLLPVRMDRNANM